MNMSRHEEQADILIMLGDVLAPLRDIVHELEEPHHDDTKIARLAAKFEHDSPLFLEQVRVFTTGEPGHNYRAQLKKIARAISTLSGQIRGEYSSADLMGYLDVCEWEAKQAILQIPTETDEVLEAHSPFQAYCCIKSHCEATNSELVWVDPYMSDSLFYRFLNGLDERVAVTLVTKDKSGQTEFDAFLDVSRLFARERGTTYRLLTERSIHDRWLVCDKRIFQLGGSAKDAGKNSPFSITKMNPSLRPSIDAIVSKATELFGPSNSTHP